MSTWTLDLNDWELRIARGVEVVAASPGYAIVSGDEIVVGEAAARRARIDPRRTYTRFWSRLSQDPLSPPARPVRHHADLAYAHLGALLRQAGAPGELVIAVPGSYGREQLGLLLGIAAACPVRVVGLVDAAVASVAPLAGPGTYAHVDIGLHQAVVTSLEVADGQCVRTAVETIEGSGITAVHDAAAVLAAEAFVRQARFDPYHQGQTEQALYDALPGWLARLDGADEVDIAIELAGRHHARLERAAVLERLTPIYERIRARVPGDAACLLSHRFAGLPGYAAGLEEARTLEPQAVFRGCVAHAALLGSDDGRAPYVTRLPAAAEPVLRPPAKRRSAAGPPVTHVLRGHRAWPLGPQPLYLAAGGRVSAHPVPGAVAVRRNGADALASGAAVLNGRPLEGEARVAPGDRVELPGDNAVYTFISVVAADGAAQA